MNQPEIGRKVMELRKNKGLTQEELGVKCGVTVRTIQRIEAGTVDPRSYTLENLGKHLEYDFISTSSPGAAWNTCIHLSSCICIVPLPLIIWTIGRQYSDIDDDAKAAVNFQFTMTVILIFFAAIAAVWAGTAGSMAESGIIEERTIITGSTILFALLTAAGALCFIEGLINCVKSLSGKKARYIPSIRFIKRD